MSPLFTKLWSKLTRVREGGRASTVKGDTSSWPVRAPHGDRSPQRGRIAQNPPVASIHAQAPMETGPAGALVDVQLAVLSQEPRRTVAEMSPRSTPTGRAVPAGLGPAAVSGQFAVDTFSRSRHRREVLVKREHLSSLAALYLPPLSAATVSPRIIPPRRDWQERFGTLLLRTPAFLGDVTFLKNCSFSPKNRR